jgi:hypothetical protein
MAAHAGVSEVNRGEAPTYGRPPASNNPAAISAWSQTAIEEFVPGLIISLDELTEIISNGGLTISIWARKM